MSLKDKYNQLKTAITGAKTSEIDVKLDLASKEISLFRTQTSRNSYIDLVKTLISQTTVGSNLSNQNLMGFGQTGVSPAAFGQNIRVMRYKTYEAIVTHINYCYRALNVIVDNIISPDDITKVALEVKAKTFLENDTKKVQSVREVIDKLDLEKHLTMVVKNTLKFGDFFSEIADSKTALLSKSIVTEDKSFTEAILTNRDDKEENIEKIEQEVNDINFKINLDFSLLNESRNKSQQLNTEDKDKKEKSKGEKLSDLKLLFYEPRQVVKLQSEAFPICFGYLVFPLMTFVPQVMIQDQLVNQLCSSILQKIEKKIPEAKNIPGSADEIRLLLHAMISKAGTNYTQVDIRYIPPERMQHFLVPSTKYYPYGESVFDTCQFSAKLLIAMETALVIHRLNRSTEKRKISIEIGLPRDAKKQIEKLREEMKKRKISLDSFGTIDTIPSMISTFEDVYIPQKDGKPFVDISTFNEGNVETRSKVEELKFIRDSIVASLGVPPAFIGLEENLSNKSTLSEENVLFARTVIHHQKYMSSQITDLVRKCVSIIDPEEALETSDIIVAFLPPKSLQFERESKYIRDVSELIKSLAELGVPQAWSKKKYLSGIDWVEIDNFKTAEKIDRNLKSRSEEEENSTTGMGGMGGLGGLGGLGGIEGPTTGGF